MSTGSKHALNWTSLLVAIPVGLAASLVTLGFRLLIEGINLLMFGSRQDVTQAIGVWPWYTWPLIVGVGGVLAGFFCATPPLLNRKRRFAPIIWK